MIKINALTEVYAILGNPVKHSLSPFIHNTAFQRYKMNKVYLTFFVSNLKKAIDGVRALDIKGLSITIPFKVSIIPYLDELDPLSKTIGAVNTVVNKNDKLIGYNTDVYGAISSIEEKIKIKDKTVVMLGAGGVARAIGYGIVNKKGNLIIYNRTIKKGKRLACELNCQFKPIEEIRWDKVDILINSTSVGMTPFINESPIDIKYLKNIVVFDTVYNPRITRLLRLAKKKGCVIIQGISMLINQAEKQFELWTGRRWDSKFKDSLTNEISR
ncbi:MAG: shikimate dehydrogenase [Candidatus Hydrogenedentota bacterium]